MNNNSRPVISIRDGSIKVSGWQNESSREDGGTYHSFRITRSYKDKAGRWQDSDRFSSSELLRVQRLLGKAYDEAVRLQADARSDDGSPDLEIVRDRHAEIDPDDVPF